MSGLHAECPTPCCPESTLCCYLFRMSGQSARCPGSPCSLDIHVSQVVCTATTIKRASSFCEFAGCSASSPDVRDFHPRRMSGLCRGCSAPLFYSFLSVSLHGRYTVPDVRPWPGCPAYPYHLHYNDRICTITIYSLLPPWERVDQSLWKSSRTLFTHSLSLIHQILDP